MKRILIPAVLALAASCKQEPPAPAVAETLKAYTIEQMMDNESVGGGSFAPDNSKLLVHSNRSGIYNLYTVSTSDGSWTPLTASDSSSVFAVSYFPKDERLLFQMDNNGDEIDHLYLRETDGSIRDLTPEAGARAMFAGWADDKLSFFFASNKRDNRFMDLYQMDLATFTPSLLYQNEAGYDLGEVSGDGKLIALSKAINTNDSDLFVYNMADGSLTQVNEVRSGNTAQDFAPDGSALYYTTDHGSEFAYLMRYDLASGAREKVLERNWDIMGSYFTEQGTYQVIYVNEDARNSIEVTEVASGKTVALPALDGMDITSVGFSGDERMMRLFAGGSNAPGNLYVRNLETSEVKQLSDVLNPEIDPAHLVKAEVVRFPSFDGLEIPAIYYLPHQASAEHPAPALVWVHGGPGGQSRQNFSSFLQYLVNHGYAVLAVNNRGSSGYGKTFYQMDDQNHGDKDLKDCIAGKDWLAAQPEIDGEKIGILGGSYGGYMTMAALTYAPDAFDVGVNLFGVTNWIRTLRSIPPWWESFKEALYTEMGDPNSADSVRLYAISPLFHTGKVTKPLIVLQGSQDPRVLQVESDEIVAGVRANGVPVEYVLFEDEGHGFVKKENQVEAYSRVLNFLDTYLKGEKAAPIRDDAMEQPELKEDGR